MTVKINGTGQVGANSGVSKRRSVSGSGFGSLIDSETDAVSTAAPLTGAGPIASVGGLIALQEAPDATQGRSKGVGRAEDLLAQLDEIRSGLLMGAIPLGRLQSLAEMIRQQRAQTDDPRLNEILGEIELRAEVELAKLGF